MRMRIRTRTAMTDISRLLQFGDSMFPIGGFSFSSGLESAVQTGVVRDLSTLRDYVKTALEQAARGDGIALVAAHRAARAGDIAALADIDREVYCRKLTDEARTMSVRMGKKLVEITAEVTQAPLLALWRARIGSGAVPGCYPVALAIHFAAQGLSAREAFIVHGYGTATTILGAALRLMRISHVDTQTLLYALCGEWEAAYARAAQSELSDMAGYAPMTDILAAVHAKAHVRLFMS